MKRVHPPIQNQELPTHTPFFNKESDQSFFSTSDSFFPKTSIQKKSNQEGEQEDEAVGAEKLVQKLSVPVAGADNSNNNNTADNIAIQRKCAECEQEEKHQEEEGVAVQRKEGDSTETVPEATPVANTPAVALFLVDDNTVPAATQMRKTAFLDRLKTEVCDSVNQALAGTPFTSANCPYLQASFARHQNSSPAQIEELIKRYCPAAMQAKSAEDLIQHMKIKVHSAALQWVKSSGDMSGISTVFGGIAGNIGSGIASAGTSVIAGIGSLLFKENAGGGAVSSQSPQAVMQRLGNGKVMEGGTRSNMEGAFGTNFSDVQIHTDSHAAQLSNEMNARAFAVGNHIAFASDEYQPGTLMGDALMAHELAHTIQQRNGETGDAQMKTGSDNAGLEEDADSISVNVMSKLSGRSDIGFSDKINKGLKSGLRISRCSKPAKKTLLEQFAEKFPDSADIIKKNPSALALVKEATDAGVEFGGFSEDGPGKWAWPYTSGNKVYVPKSHLPDKVLAVSDFLFELNNGIRQPKFKELNKEAAKGSKGSLDAKLYARKNVELEVEGMLRLGEVWFEMKKNVPAGENWNKYDSDFYLQSYNDYKDGKKTKTDIVNSVLTSVYPEGVNKGKTVEQYYIEQYNTTSGGK